MAFNTDGTKLWVITLSIESIGTLQDDSIQISEFDLSIPYDTSTMTLDTTYDFGDKLGANNSTVIEDPLISAIHFNSDGTKFFVLFDESGDDTKLLEYNLGTAWDLATAPSTPSQELEFAPTQITGCPLGLARTDLAEIPGGTFNSDGTQYIISVSELAGTRSICSFPLATAYDVSTLDLTAAESAENVLINPANSFESTYGLSVTRDGSQILAAQIVSANSTNPSNDTFEFQLGTPGDVSTAVQTFERLDEGTEISLVALNPGQTKMYLLDGDGGGEIHQYGLLPQNLRESDANDGSIDNSDPIQIKLHGDTWADADNDDIVDNSTFSVSAPAGLTPVLSLSEGDTLVTLTFTGNANSHSSADNLDNLLFQFSDANFTGGDAANVFQSGFGAAHSIGNEGLEGFGGLGIDFGDAPAGVNDNLRLWLDASTAVSGSQNCNTLAAPADGGDVLCWRDQSYGSLFAQRDGAGSGASTNLAGTNNVPDYTENGINFRPEITFDSNGQSNGDYLSVEGAFGGHRGILEDETFADAHVYTVLNVNSDRNTLFSESVGGVEADVNEFSVFPYFNGTHYWYAGNSLGDQSISVATPGVGEPALLSFNSRTTSNVGQAIRRNGEEVDADTTAQPFQGFRNEMNIGVEPGNNDTYLDGSISEIIIYAGDEVHTPDDQRQIESYLALKYGITLDASSLNYSNSSNTNIYDLSTHENDVVGIMRDDAGRLDQQISKSVNTGAILTLSTDMTFTGNNGTHASLSDGQSVVVGHDDGDTSTQVTELNTADYDLRVEREWKIAHKGGATSVNMQFDGFDNEFVVLADADGDFATGAREIGRLDSNGRITVPLGNTPASQIADGEFFTLAGSAIGPGGVIPNLSLWFKADDNGATTTDGATVATWTNFGAGNDATATGDPSFENDTASLINFNPIVNTDINDRFNIAGAPSIETSMVFAVGIPTGTGDLKTVFRAVEGPPAQDFALAVARDPVAGLGVIANDIVYHDRHGSNTTRPSGLSWLPDEVALVQGVMGTTSTDVAQYSKNGGAFASTPTGTDFSAGGTYSALGNQNGTGRNFGNIAETAVYDVNTLTPGEVQKINSYFALKYGITLDSSVDEYLSSATTTVYDLTASTYNNNIVGIGYDSNGGLDQRVSQSVATTSVLTIATDDDFVSANGGARSQMENMDFVVIGANTDTAVVNQSTELPAAYNTRPDREWRLENTGDVASVEMKFDGYDDTWTLLADDDGDFTTGARALGTLNSDGEISVDLGNTPASEIADGEYFTLAKFQASPGGVTSGLELWIKADEGTNTNGSNSLTTTGGDAWSDQSGNNRHFDFVSGDPALQENELNFNPAVEWDGDDFLRDDTNDQYFSSFTEGQHFGVVRDVSPDTPASGFFHHFGGSSGSHYTWSNGYIYDGFGHSLRSAWDSNNIASGPIGGGSNDFTDANTFGSNVDQTDWNVFTSAIDNSSFEAYMNGGLQFQDTSVTPSFVSSIPGAHIGSTGAGWNFHGHTAEHILYSNKLSAIDQQKVDSYLALKYGITLASTTADYLSASSTTQSVYDLTSGYDQDVFGIARDDIQGLDQRVSKSVNTGFILTLSTNNDFVSSNATTTRPQLDNGEYLVIGNNGATTTATTTEIQTGYLDRTEREWRVENTGNITSLTINLKFDGFDDEWHLLTDADGNFGSGVTSQGKLSAAGEILSVPLTDGMYFTLARTPIDPVTIVTPTANQIVALTTAVTGACEPGATVSIASGNITPDPTTGTCTASSTYSIDVDFVLTATTTELVASQTSGSVTSATTSVTVLVDADGDGVPNSVEDAGANGGDGDGDGIADSTQQNVSGALNPVTGTYSTLRTDGACTFITENAFVAESSLTAQDPSAEYPVGLVDFQVTCPSAGDSADVTIYYTQQYNTSDWAYKKYNSVTGNVYSDITALATFADHTYTTGTASGTTVTTVSFTVTDGDPQTDEDTGPANNVINDPSGPAVPTVSSSSGGGSGNAKRVCRDPEASNYKSFGKSDSRLCEYDEESGETDVEEDSEQQESTDLRKLLGGAESNVPAEFQGEVCTRYMRGYVFPNSEKNDIEEVKKLQVFLNEAYNENLAVDGTYDADDIEAVKRYQLTHQEQILWPWNLTTPTANVYRTTVTKLNLEMCGYEMDEPYFTEYLGVGDVSLESVRVQDFINLTNAPTSGYPTNGLPLTKTYTQATANAVSAYQDRYKKTVLEPWGLTKGTGWWYQTTRSSANALVGTPEPAKTLDNGKSHTAF